MVRRVFVIATDSAGCWYYRLHLPLTHLNPNEFEVHWSPPPPLRTTSDIVIGQRIAGKNTAWEEMCEDLFTVYDLDDDLTNIDPSNEVPYSIYAPIAKETEYNISIADVVTVSTPALRDKMLNLNPNVIVLPNCVHGVWLKPANRDPHIVTIGWAGSMFHAQDWGGVSEVLQKVAERFPEVRFHMVGANYTQGVPHVRTSPWGNMSLLFHELDFDIGIAPLVPTPFNECKSWIKLLEYASRGIPAVAPMVGQYLDWIRPGTNGYLYPDLDDMRDFLELLVANKALRESLGNAAMEKARRYEISQQVHRWERVYRGEF